jgi:hypothetical protein
MQEKYGPVCDELDSILEEASGRQDGKVNELENVGVMFEAFD